MTVTLSPETEAKLRERAEREGRDVSLVADALISAALEWEALDREEALAGIRRGLEASAAGRVRSARDVFADMRARILHVRHVAQAPGGEPSGG
jgi:predicted transcriptional regulator